MGNYAKIIATSVLALLLLLLPQLWPAAAPFNPTAVPHFSLPSGLQQPDSRLQLRSPSPQAEVIFTLNGRLPTPTTAATYRHPILLDASQPAVVVVRARLRWRDGTLGPVASASYFLNLPTSLPRLSLIIEPADLETVLANYNEHGREWERPLTAVYHDPRTQTGFTIDAGVRIHGRISRSEAKKSFRLYFRREYGAARLDYPLFCPPPACPTSFDRLVIHNSGQDSPTLPASLTWVNWTILRNQLAARLARDVGTLPTSHNQPALLFINGQPWGIYTLRQRIDDTYLAGELGIARADMLDTPESSVGDDQVTLGDRQHWDNLLHYVETHDLADPAAYAYVQTQIDLDNFIDYQLFQIFVANDDWPMHNVRQFRAREPNGRWHWLIWDIDRGFNFTPPSSIDKNMFLRAEELTHPLTTNKHTLLYRRLLQNPDFRQRYLARLDELLDTAFSPANVTQHLDSLVAEIEPLLDYEIGRWQPDKTAWAANVADIRLFAQQRAAIVREQAAAHFGKTAVFPTTTPP